MLTDLVTIIIPCYNAAGFISDTLNSILNQRNVTIEIIIINDGSTDSSELMIKSFQDPRIRYYHQINNGVSSARNYGLTLAKGKYVVFFDSDDIMTDDFVFSRIKSFEKNVKADVICGIVQKFDINGLIPGYYIGPDNENLSEQILLYQQNIITCPSNFMFKRSFLLKYDLKFNSRLSSTADRYFLLECYKVGAILFDEQVSFLHYRVSPNSMSHVLTKSLVNDNMMFYNELKLNRLISLNIEQLALFYGYYMLSGANYKVNNYYFAAKYGFMAFFISPLNFIKKVLN